MLLQKLTANISNRLKRYDRFLSSGVFKDPKNDLRVNTLLLLSPPYFLIIWIFYTSFHKQFCSTKGFRLTLSEKGSIESIATGNDYFLVAFYFLNKACYGMNNNSSSLQYIYKRIKLLKLTIIQFSLWNIYQLHGSFVFIKHYFILFYFSGDCTCI